MAATTKLPLKIGGDSTGALVGHDPKNPKRDAKMTRMGTASIPALITEFAIPSIVGLLVNGAYNIIASIFLGQAMGEIGPSTMAAVNPIMTFFIAISMLVGVGGNALAALRLGERKRIDAEVSLGNTVTLSLIASVLVILCAMIPAVLNSFITLASAPEEVRPYAAAFTRIISFGFIFQCIGTGVNNFIRTAGAPNRALLTMVIGAVACIIFNYLFVLQFHWGFEGCALATVCGQGLSCVSVLWYFIFTKNVPLKLHLRYMKPHAKVLKTILSLGQASFFIQAGVAVGGLVMNYLVTTYGAASPLGSQDSLAAIGVVQRVVMFTLLPIFGVSVAIQPLIGYNYGARLVPRVRKTFWYGVVAAVALGAVMWVFIHLFATQIAEVFGITHEGLVDFTAFALKVQLMMIPLIGFQVVGSNYFQATGQPLKSALLTLTRSIIFLIPLMLVLPQVLPTILPDVSGLAAICFAAPTADFLSIFTTGVFIFFEMRRLTKLERGEIKAKYLSDPA